MLMIVHGVEIESYKNEVGFVCYDEQDRIVYDDEKVSRLFKHAITKELESEAWETTLVGYFESLQSSDYFKFGQIEIEVKQAVNRILAKDGLLDLYVQNLDGSCECLHSSLVYLINEEIKEMLKEEIEKLESLYSKLDPDVMTWV